MLLYIPRQAFDFNFWGDKYEARTMLVREKLDMARIIHEDRAKGVKYNATTPLNQEIWLCQAVMTRIHRRFLFS